jgi:hypothetical protein
MWGLGFLRRARLDTISSCCSGSSWIKKGASFSREFIMGMDSKGAVGTLLYQLKNTKKRRMFFHNKHEHPSF